MITQLQNVPCFNCVCKTQLCYMLYWSLYSLILNDNMVSLLDVDECRKTSTQLCQHICVNTPGSYRCRCKSGFIGGKFCKGKKISENNTSLELSHFSLRNFSWMQTYFLWCNNDKKMYH